MQQNFTQEDIILYIYNELDPSKRADLEMAIATEPEVLTFFQESLLMVHQLDQINDEPSNTVISILFLIMMPRDIKIKVGRTV